MSKQIDERVVEMQFDNKKFEKNIAKSTKSLEKLKKSLEFEEVNKSLKDLEKTTSNVSFNGMVKNIEKISDSFTLMGRVAINAMDRMASYAVQTGIRMAQALSTDQIGSGFNEYNLKIDATRTLINSTGASAEKVNETIDELNEYSDKTVYRLSDMVGNFFKFTNNNATLEEGATLLMGFANAAALAGSSTQNYASALYNLAQSFSHGYMTVQDWRSIEYANMATTQMKQTAIDTAVELGTLQKVSDGLYKTIKGNHDVTVDNFRDTLQYEWFDRKVMIGTAAKFLSTETELGKAAWQAAQEVRTVPKLIDTLKESAQSGWAQTWEIIIGDINEATETLTDFNNGIGSVIDGTTELRNNFLHVWSDLGGREDVINTLKNVGHIIRNITKEIWNGWFSVSAETGGEKLSKITHTIEQATEKIRNWLWSNNEYDGEWTILAGIRRSVSGVRAALGIVTDAVWSFRQAFVGASDESIPAFNIILALLAKAGDWLKDFREEIREKGYFTTIFGNLVKVLKPLTDHIPAILDRIKTVLNAIGKELSQFDIKGTIINAIIAVSELIPKLSNAVWGFITKIYNRVKSGAGSGKIGEFFSSIGKSLITSVQTITDAMNKFDGTGFIQWLRDTFTTIWNEIKTGVSNAANILFGADTWGKIKDSSVVRKIREIFSSVANAVSNGFFTILEQISAFDANNVWVWIKSTFNRLTTWVGASLSGFAQAVLGLDIWNKIKANPVVAKIREITLAIKNALSNVFVAISAAVKSFDISNLWNSIKNVFSAGWTALKSELEKSWAAIKTFFTNIDYAGVWGSIKTWFATTWVSVKEFINNLGQTLFGADTWNKFINSRAIIRIKNAFISFGNMIKDAVEWLKRIFASIDLSGIKNWFTNLFLTSEDNLSEANSTETPLTKAAKKTESVFTKIGNIFKNAWEKLSKIPKFFTIGNALLYGGIFLTIKAFMAIINLVSGAGTALSALGKHSSLVEKCEALTKFVLALTGAIAALAIMNTFMGPGVMWSAVGQLAAAVIAVEGISVAMQWLSKKLGGETIKIDPVLQIGVGLVAMFVAITAFATLDWPTLWVGLARCAIVMGGLMVVLGLLQFVFGLIDKFGQGKDKLGSTGSGSLASAAKAFLEIAAALVLMIVPISVLGSLPQETFSRGVRAVAICMAGLAIIAYTAGKNNFKFSNGAAILATALALVAIVPAIAVLGLFSDDMIARSSVMLLVIGVFIAAMVYLLKSVQEKKLDNLIPAFSIIIVAAGAIWAFASALAHVKNVDWVTIAAFSAGFAVAVIAFATALKILEKVNFASGMKGIGLLGIAVVALSVAASIAAVIVGSGLEAFTSYLAPIGQNLAAFATAVKDVDKDKITAAGEALLSIAELCGQSFLYSFTGGQIQSFTEKATSIAYNIAAFSTAVANVSVSNVENASKALKIITAMMMDAKTNGTTSDTPVTMTEHALSVASNLNGFCTRLSNFSLLKIISAKTGLTQISSLMSYASNNGTTSDTPVTMTEHALSVATNLTAFCERLGEKFNLIKIVAACAGIVMLSSTFVGIAEADTTKIDSFSDNLTKVGGGLSQFMDGIAAYDDAGKQKIENASELMGKIKQLALDLQETTGIADQLNDISGAVTTLGSALDLYYKMASGVGETGEGTTTLSPEQVGEGLGAMISAVVAKLPDDNAVQAIAAYAGGEGTGNNMSLFAAGLNAIARALKDYGTNCNDLDEDAVKLGNSVLDEVTKIPGKLSGENNLLSFLSSNQTSLSSFATDLTSISTGLGNFATNTKDLTSGSVSAASEALTLLVGLQNSLDSSASIWTFLKGDNSLGSFATTLPTIGDGLKDFYHRTWHISSKMATGGIEMLTQLTTANINYSNIGQLANAFGGAGGWATGAEDLKTFTEHLTTMGDSIGGFYKATKDISAVGEGEKFGSVQLLDQLIALSTKYGNTLNIGKSFWGITGIFTGSGDLSSFTGKFEAISGHIGTFYTNISQVDFAKAGDAVGFLTLMASLESTFPNLGSNNLEALGGRLADFSGSLLTMNNNLTSLTLNEDNYARMVAIIREFIGLQASLNEVMAGQTVDMNKIALSTDATDATSMTNFLTFGSAIVEVADMITMANSELSGDNVANFELAADGLSHLVNAIYTAQGLSEADGGNLVEVIRGFVDNNLSDKQINTDNMVGAWMLWIGKSIAGSVGVLTTDIQTFMTGVTTTFDTYITSFETSGQNFALGFAGGLTNEAALAATISAANTLASTALSTLNDNLEIHSPSRKTEQTGKYLDLGLVKGVEKYTNSIEDPMGVLGDLAMDTLTDNLIKGGGKATKVIGNVISTGAKSVASNTAKSFATTLIDTATGGILTKYDSVAGTLSDFAETVEGVTGKITISDASGIISAFKSGGIEGAEAYISELYADDPYAKKLAEYLKLYGITQSGNASNISAMGEVSDAIAASGSSVSKAAVDMSKIISLYDAINKVGSSVDLLGEKVASMQIVMDSGALVGSIETQIDTRLGTMTALRSRGV